MRLTGDVGRRRLVIGIARRDIAAAAALVTATHPAALHLVLHALSALQQTS
ncbi:hypothetical protein [Gryllotalpicola protaetiae]|uniref:hypothetical protein n=1 Tax=Gryllotalpicola protaetiae TaxID=2419771 RepID=UPI0013C4EF8C|nr:hypothetical protein [Gryllotalpicola protaetiae]